ncbi:MAG TPA: hypothetical protein DCQ52_07400, partial [Acidimicrobiaceae bacterium]|nr:hypothetical protein [Acidimicrobiaceae bacterium]
MRHPLVVDRLAVERGQLRFQPGLGLGIEVGSDRLKLGSQPLLGKSFVMPGFVAIARAVTPARV